MRKLICLLAVLMLCVSLIAPAYATDTVGAVAGAEEGFVPSITYKPLPEIVQNEELKELIEEILQGNSEIDIEIEEGAEIIGVIRDEEGQVVDVVEQGCLDITPVAHIWDEEEEVPADVETLLLFVYEGLNNQELEIPYEDYQDEHNVDLKNDKMVVRDLFDVRWNCDEHEGMHGADGTTFDITFDLGIGPDVEVFVTTYDEEGNLWNPILKTVNNGDGTVTCTFEHFCAVVFSIPLSAISAPVDEVPTSTNVMPWIILLAVAVAVAAIFLILLGKKKKKDEEEVQA